MSNRKVANFELTDILAEILLKKYPIAYSYEADSLAWAAKALGSTKNARYYNVLSEVADSAEYKKIVKHANKALDNLGAVNDEPQYVAGMYSLPDELYAKETVAVRDQRIIALLMSGDLRDLKQRAEKLLRPTLRVLS